MEQAVLDHTVLDVERLADSILPPDRIAAHPVTKPLSPQWSKWPLPQANSALP
jgi:hypothetical protein